MKTRACIVCAEITSRDKLNLCRYNLRTMKTLSSIVLLHALLVIIAIGQQMETGDGKKIIIVMTGGRVENVQEQSPETTLNKRRHRKKEKWLLHWVKKMMLSKKL